MEKKKILYFPDYRYGMDKEPEVVAALKKALPEYGIVSIDLMFLLKNTKSVEDRIEEVLKEVQPDVIIADGLGGFFAHTLSGFNRICVNPILSASLHLNGNYADMEERQFSYNREPDKENSTYCWGVFGKHVNEEEFSLLHYPNVINIDKRVNSIKDAMDTVIPLIQSISQSKYMDDYGVHYTNYGRTLVKADYVISRNMNHYVVPNGVLTICECAFSGIDIKSVTLPDSLRHIGKYAFSDCRNLESVAIPKHVDVIHEGCFDGCVSLRDVQLPKTVFSIHSQAFTRTDLKEVTIPDSIQGIAVNAFDEGVKLVISASRLTELLRDSMHYHTIQDSQSEVYDI